MTCTYGSLRNLQGKAFWLKEDKAISLSEDGEDGQVRITRDVKSN